MRKIFNYSQFVNEEKKEHFSSYKGSRSESLDHLFTVNDIEALLQKYAPYFLEEKNIDSSVGGSALMPVYRGVERKGDIAIVRPSSHDRVSRNTENYYTLIIDDTWDNFPNRSKSLIASTSRNRAEEYGKAYRIIPTTKKAFFGIAPKADIWISFKKGIEYINEQFGDFFQYTSYYTGVGNDLNDLNAFLKEAFGLEREETLEGLKDKLTVHNFVHNNVSILYSGDEDGEENTEEVEKLEAISRDGSLYHIFEQALSPNFNKGFKSMKFIDTDKFEFGFEREVWTESECLMIEADAFDKWMRKKFYMPTSDKFGWAIKNGMSTDPRLKTDEERRKRVEESK